LDSLITLITSFLRFDQSTNIKQDILHWKTIIYPEWNVSGSAFFKV